MAKVIFCHILLLLAACALAQESPCPQMFLYEYDGKSWIGVIRLPTSIFGTTIKILLTMALEAQLPDTVIINFRKISEVIVQNQSQNLFPE